MTSVPVNTLKFFQGILVFMLLTSCTNSMKEINAVSGTGQSMEDRGKDVTILYSDGGKIKVRMFTHDLIRNETAVPPYTDLKNGLKVEFFNDSAVVKNILTARNARWYANERNILIRDSVKLENDKGETLETSELVWNQSIEKFFTEKPVSITTATQIIYGTGMEANQDFTSYKITKITGNVRVNKNEVPQ